MVVFIDLVMTVVNKDTAESAIKKVSVSEPDPNFAPIRISLKKPRSLLKEENNMIKATDLAAFVDLDMFAPSISWCLSPSFMVPGTCYRSLAPTIIHYLLL